MNKVYILFNPLSGQGLKKEKIDLAKNFFQDFEIVEEDITKIENIKDYLSQAQKSDKIVIIGGDGTLNRFANSIREIVLPCEIYYLASGTGNDFLKDIEKNDNEIVDITKYLKNLPVATIKGEEYLFINGVGYGIDGYCCEVGDKQKEENPDKKVNYTGIAIKGLLGGYKPCDATVTVDGKTYEFKKVWIAPTMNGRFYGGGMIATPNQERESGKVSLMIFHGSGKLKTLMIFPKIFKGEHVKSTKHVSVFEGNEITVKFTKPRPLQVDGETILDVTEYTVKSACQENTLKTAV